MPDRRYFPVDFQTAYRTSPPWDTGRPQSALVSLADRSRGAVLDVGCGTGEHALFYAARGHEAWGIDQVPLAIETAQAKAAHRGLDACFRVGEALALEELGRQFDLVVDSGLFHAIPTDHRDRYVESLRAAVRPGGAIHLLCFSEREPGRYGPHRVTQAELREAFAEGWEVRAIEEAHFEVRRPALPHAWLAVIERSAQPEAPHGRRRPVPSAGALADELNAEIEAVEFDRALNDEASFTARAEAIDRLEFHVIDRLRAVAASSPEVIALGERAEMLTQRLAAIDQRYVTHLRDSIAEGALRGPALRRELARHARVAATPVFEYDPLDLLVDGLLHPEEDVLQSGPLKAREPDMVFYQPTPARLVLELGDALALTPESVFCDVGSGLGQVCILVGLLTGARSVGIEFEPTYCDYARRSARRMSLEDVELINADARAADYQAGTVYFMYTPFRGEMMERVLGRIERASRGGPVAICTLGTCTEQVAQQSWLTRVAPPDGRTDALTVFTRNIPSPASGRGLG